MYLKASKPLSATDQYNDIAFDFFFIQKDFEGCESFEQVKEIILHKIITPAAAYNKNFTALNKFHAHLCMAYTNYDATNLDENLYFCSFENNKNYITLIKEMAQRVIFGVRCTYMEALTNGSPPDTCFTKYLKVSFYTCAILIIFRSKSRHAASKLLLWKAKCLNTRQKLCHP